MYLKIKAAKLGLTGGLILSLIHFGSNAVVMTEQALDYEITLAKERAAGIIAEQFGYEKPKPEEAKLTPLEIAEREALRAGLNPSLVRAVLHVESRHNRRAISPKGALGYMQVMPANAFGCGIQADDLLDAEPNIKCGVSILRRGLISNDWDLEKGLLEYNGGATCKAVVLKCGRDLRCMGYKSDKEKGCAESYLYSRDVMKKMGRDIG